MTQVPPKLVDVVSALETLKLPYVLYREESGSHRVLLEGSSEAAVLNALAEALGPEVINGIDVVPTDDADIEEISEAAATTSPIVIEVQYGTGKSTASMLWWLALREGSKAARAVAHADLHRSNIVVFDGLPRNKNPE